MEWSVLLTKNGLPVESSICLQAQHLSNVEEKEREHDTQQQHKFEMFWQRHNSTKHAWKVWYLGWVIKTKD